MDQRQSPEFLPKNDITALDYDLIDAVLHTDVLAGEGENVMSAEVMNEQTAGWCQTEAPAQPGRPVSEEESNNGDGGRKLSLRLSWTHPLS